MPAKPPPRRPGRPKGSGMKGHVQVLLQLRPDQRGALLVLAEARREPGRPPPISEVARELLDKAMKRKR